MTAWLRQVLMAGICLGVLLHPRSLAQTNNGSAEALTSWIALDAPVGWEHLATDTIKKTMPEWQRDTSGNLILRRGNGSPRRVVACALDRSGYVVSEITDKGFLRLRESSGVRQHPLWDQFHEGQRIKILTRKGGVPGVVAVWNAHLHRVRNNLPITTVNDLWIDVGARSQAEIERLGIELLDPIVRDLPPWSYADYVAGPTAGLRVGCAAIAAASRAEISSGETIFLLTTQRSFNHAGLSAALSKLGHIDELTLVDQLSETNSSNAEITIQRLKAPAYIPESTGLSSIQIISPVVRYKGTLVESVLLSDAEKMLAAVEKAAAVKAEKKLSWISLPFTMPSSPPNDSFSSLAGLLQELADLPGASGHEELVRNAIGKALPDWARQRLVADEAGNLTLSIGPDRDPVMFIAHQDEVGFEITHIAPDGAVTLKPLGGMLTFLWEGQPAILPLDQKSETLKGIFIPRENATSKISETTTAWFGMEAAGLEKLGVKIGHSVIAYKKATRLGGSRFTARSLDDRAGSTALIMALRQINPEKLTHKIIFAWSVKEETGLLGAQVLATKWAATVERVYSIDTFVSSETPLESSRFAFTPLGKGAVLRGLDNGSIVVPAEIDRITRVAQMHRIPLQRGTTNGGTDGSVFVRFGALHSGLSWPGRYSHSPVEILDLQDLQALANLIAALATTTDR